MPIRTISLIDGDAFWGLFKRLLVHCSEARLWGGTHVANSSHRPHSRGLTLQLPKTKLRVDGQTPYRLRGIHLQLRTPHVSSKLPSITSNYLIGNARQPHACDSRRWLPRPLSLVQRFVTLHLTFAENGQLLQPRNLLFIEPDVPSRTSTPGATTPISREHSPIDHPAGNIEQGNGVDGGVKAERKGRIGQTEMALPDVHAEPAEYYGGNQVWSRARTFSSVSVCPQHASTSANAFQTGLPASSRAPQMGGETILRNRRLSHGERIASSYVLISR